MGGDQGISFCSVPGSSGKVDCTRIALDPRFKNMDGSIGPALIALAVLARLAKEIRAPSGCCGCWTCTGCHTGAEHETSSLSSPEFGPQEPPLEVQFTTISRMPGLRGSNPQS